MRQDLVHAMETGKEDNSSGGSIIVNVIETGDNAKEKGPEDKTIERAHLDNIIETEKPPGDRMCRPYNIPHYGLQVVC